jgi:hypothetical protein
MRPVVFAMVAVVVIGFFSPSDVSAAPANGVAIGQAATAAQIIEKAQRYRRYPRRRGRTYGYRSYAPSDAESLHQLSEENQQRAQQNAGGLGH